VLFDPDVRGGDLVVAEDGGSGADTLREGVGCG